MFLVKIIIGITSVAVSIKIGSNFAKKRKIRYEFLRSTQIFLEKVESELIYQKKSILEILESGSYSTEFLEYINDTYEENGKKVEFLEENENAYLKDFILNLGNGDSMSRLKLISGAKSYFEKLTLETYKDYKKYYSLCIKLGFICGFAVLVIII